MPKDRGTDFGIMFTRLDDSASQRGIIGIFRRCVKSIFWVKTIVLFRNPQKPPPAPSTGGELPQFPSCGGVGVVSLGGVGVVTFGGVGMVTFGGVGVVTFGGVPDRAGWCQTR
jgi:hypothetical protein